MKDLNLSVLFDVYASLLSQKQRNIFDSYYNNDLSLSEISENEGITRQGVSDSLRRSAKELKELEEKLGLIALKSELKSKAKCAATQKDFSNLISFIEEL